MIQIFGGVKSLSGTSDDKQSGFDIMKIGLAVQLVFFGLFLIISFRFHFVSKTFKGVLAWYLVVSKFLWILNISVCLIFVSYDSSHIILYGRSGLAFWGAGKKAVLEMIDDWVTEAQILTVILQVRSIYRMREFSMEFLRFWVAYHSSDFRPVQ